MTDGPSSAGLGHYACAPHLLSLSLWCTFAHTTTTRFVLRHTALLHHCLHAHILCCLHAHALAHTIYPTHFTHPRGGEYSERIIYCVNDGTTCRFVEKIGCTGYQTTAPATTTPTHTPLSPLPHSLPATHTAPYAHTCLPHLARWR